MNRTKILRIALQVLILLGAGLLLGRYVFEEGTPPVRDRASWSGRHGFVAISYAGIGHESDQRDVVTKERLREHVEALTLAGYTSVTTQDVVDFYEKGKPLPDKAVYLMFEGGRKDSVMFSQPVLAEFGAVATAFIPTSTLDGWNRFFLHAGEVGQLAGDIFWDIGSMGHDPYAAAMHEDGAVSYPLVTQVTQANGMPESLQAFRKRIEDDLATASITLQKATGAPAHAFVLVPANTLDQSMPEARRNAVKEAIRQHYRIAFINEGDCFNSRDADPLALSRLLVRAEWSAGQLLAELESRQPKTEPDSFPEAGDAGIWQARLGSIKTAGPASVRLVRDSRGAFAMLRGTEALENASFSVLIQPSSDAGALVYLRYRSVDSYLRLQVDENRILVQEKAGGKLALLHQYLLQSEVGAPVLLEGVLKGNRLMLRVDGRPAAEQPLPLAESTERGSFGLGILKGNTGNAGALHDASNAEDGGNADDGGMTFSSLSVRPLPAVWLQVHVPARVEFESMQKLATLVLPLRGLLDDRAYVGLVGRAASQGVDSLVRIDARAGVPGVVAARAILRERCGETLARLLRGFVVRIEPGDDPLEVRRMLDTIREAGQLAAIEVAADTVAVLADLPVPLEADMMAVDVLDGDHPAGLERLKNRYDKTRMLFRPRESAETSNRTFRLGGR